MIHVTCPSCGHNHGYPKALRGLTVVCNRCGRPNPVPAGSPAPVPLPPITASAPAIIARAPPTARKPWLMLAVAVGVILLGATVLLSRNRPTPPPTPPVGAAEP